MVNVECFRIFALSKLGQTLLVLCKKEKIQRFCTTYGQTGHFQLWYTCRQGSSSSYLIDKIYNYPFYIQSLKALRPFFHDSEAQPISDNFQAKLTIMS